MRVSPSARVYELEHKKRAACEKKRSATTEWVSNIVVTRCAVESSGVRHQPHSPSGCTYARYRRTITAPPTSALCTIGRACVCACERERREASLTPPRIKKVGCPHSQGARRLLTLFPHPSVRRRPPLHRRTNVQSRSSDRAVISWRLKSDEAQVT